MCARAATPLRLCCCYFSIFIANPSNNKTFWYSIMPTFLHETSHLTVSSKPASDNMSDAHLIEKDKALLPTFEHEKDGDSKIDVGVDVDEQW